MHDQTIKKLDINCVFNWSTVYLNNWHVNGPKQLCVMITMSLSLYVFCLGAPPSSLSGLYLVFESPLGGIGHDPQLPPPLLVLAALLGLQLMLISSSSFWMLLHHRILDLAHFHVSICVLSVPVHHMTWYTVCSFHLTLVNDAMTNPLLVSSVSDGVDRLLTGYQQLECLLKHFVSLGQIYRPYHDFRVFREKNLQTNVWKI